jgi:Protein export membrane protein
VLNTFALTLIIGIIIGTYSSIYVASPVVVIWKQFTDRRKPAVVPVAAARPAAVPPAPRPASPSAPPAPRKKKSRR